MASKLSLSAMLAVVAFLAVAETASAASVLGFMQAPKTMLRLHSASRVCSARPGILALRCADERKEEGETYVKLDQTQTSWTGWGASSGTKKEVKIEVDASNPDAAVKEALKRAREFEDIAKYLGTTESKQRSGITGDVEFVKMSGSELTLRLVGNFWHNRQVVFSEVGDFIKKALPAGTVQSVVIEDQAQLQGFAETSKAFQDRKQITEDDLNAVEAKELKNVWGETLEGPAAEFRRKKAEAEAKYKEEMEKRKELDGKGDAEQIQAIMKEKGLDMFGNAVAVEDNLRPEDILKQM